MFSYQFKSTEEINSIILTTGAVIFLILLLLILAFFYYKKANDDYELKRITQLAKYSVPKIKALNNYKKKKSLFEIIKGIGEFFATVKKYIF